MEDPRESIVYFARLMYREGLVTGTSGNISIRTERGILITPSHYPYEKMTPEDVVLLSEDARVLEGRLKPSVEHKMHLAIYHARDDVNAIMHVHSPAATALASAHVEIPVFHDEMIIFLKGPVKVSEYAPAGTQELAENVVKALGNRMATLIANHGSVAVGKNIEEAHDNVQLVERLAQIYILARLVGGVHPLNF
ncbi:MAG: class II aldolase/adducin family protein [Candidatus Korarchaeota archaeon]